MPSNKPADTPKQINCDADAKAIFSKLINHNKCTKRGKGSKYAVKVSGKELNSFLHPTFCSIVNCPLVSCKKKPFIGQKKYFICHNLQRTMSKPISMKYFHNPSNFCVEIADSKSKKISSDDSTPTPQPTGIPNISREDRLFLRNRIPAKDLKGIKQVNLKIQGDDDVIIDLNLPHFKKKTSYNMMFNNEVLSMDNYFKLPFGKLTMKQRRLRIATLSKKILSACIDRNQYNEDGQDYLHGNENLAVDVINLIDGMKEFLQSKMKINFNSVQDIPMVPLDKDNEGSILFLDDNKKKHQLAQILLGENSNSGYKRITDKMSEMANSQALLPTTYMLDKKRGANIVPISYESIPDTRTDMSFHIPLSSTTCPVYNNENEELESALIATSKPQELKGAMIQGGFKTCIELLKEKHQKQGRIISTDNKPIVIDSFDGAEHLRSKKKITSVISFSSSLLTGNWINKKLVTAGSSLNILTWQQLNCTESFSTIMPSVKDYYKDKKDLRESDSNSGSYFYYDMHDGKMLYLLTQHSLWNRKHHPFLLCACKRGEGVINNETHKCTILNDDEQMRLFQRSNRRWDLKLNDQSYGIDHHKDWIDKNNSGISHLGIHPKLLPRSSLRFDTFHMKCSITRRLMSTVRNFILNQSTNTIERFSKLVLKSFWNDYHLYVWNNKKSFASLVGNELALFVSNIDEVVEFFNSNFVTTPITNSICNGLKIWLRIFKFLGITYLGHDVSIKEYEDHYLQDFKDDLVNFYSFGRSTYLATSPSDVDGNGETFYMHTLRFYIPYIATETFKLHQCGVGIFTMQGFERRNKESKNCLQRFSNNKGNILVNNMKRVWDIFENDMNNY